MAEAQEEAETSNKMEDGYQPAAGFKIVNDMQPLLTEAALPNKELWLLRIPMHGLSMKDLANKEWNLRLNSSSGHLGHFRDSAGNKYNIQRADHKGSKKYAYIPTETGSVAVREVSSEVSFVKALEKIHRPAVAAPVAQQGAEPSMSHETKSGVTKDKSSGSQGVSQGLSRKSSQGVSGVSQGTSRSQGVSQGRAVSSQGGVTSEGVSSHTTKSKDESKQSSKKRKHKSSTSDTQSVQKKSKS